MSDELVYPETGSSNTSEEQQEQPSPGQTTTQDQSGGQPSAVEFSHPSLKGKTPEQIEKEYLLLHETVREQGRKLSELAQRPQPQPQQQPQLTVDPKQFWENPTEVLAQLVQNAVAPLREEIRLAKQELRAPTIRERLRMKYDDFSTYEPIIDQLLAQRGLDPLAVGEAELETLYFTAVGFATRRGFVKPQEQGKETQSVKPVIPQHRPSAAPLPNSQQNKPKIRELTEYERRLAREWGMTPEEYIRWQEASDEEVALPEPKGGS